MILTDRCHVDVRDTWQVVLYLDRSMCGALKSNLGFFNSNPIKFLLEFILLQKREIKLFLFIALILFLFSSHDHHNVISWLMVARHTGVGQQYCRLRCWLLSRQDQIEK